MPHVWRDRVRETATSAGTGVYTLTGAVAGFRRFANAMVVGDTAYAIALNAAGEWVSGLYTYSATNTLTLTTTGDDWLGSGEGGGIPAGACEVFLTATAASFTRWRADVNGGDNVLSNVRLRGYTEPVFSITDAAAFEIDPANGSIQTIVLGASRTPKGTNFLAGQSVLLMVDDGSARSLTWTDTTFGPTGVIFVAGISPPLPTTGWALIELWKVGAQVYGAHVGNVA
jgi:hypothetical protein